MAPHAVSVTSHGPVGDFGYNVVAFDLTTGAQVGVCDLPHLPTSVLYRPGTDDLLVTTTGDTQGGMLHRLDRSLNLLQSTPLAVPPVPSTHLWSIQLVRSDYQGGLYVTYQPSPSGTAAGDQLLRQLDPVTLAPLHDWRTFLVPLDGRSLVSADFAADGQHFFFAMVGGPDPNQHVIYRLTLAPALAAPFATYGTWSGGSNPTGQTYINYFLRPRPDGTYVAATYHVTAGSTDANTLLLIAADGTVTTAYPVLPLSPVTNRLTGLAVSADGGTAWFMTSNGVFAQMQLATGVETVIATPGYGLNDLVVVPDAVAPASYHLDTRAVRRLRRAPHVAQDNQRVVYRRFELDLERGQARADGQGSDPMVLLRISRDGGQTWGEEIRMAAGALGAYTQRVIARRLGQARDTVFEVVVSDPIAWALVGAWLDLEPGTT
jgi:hypothetical protein